jgi:hypothetical protein
VFNAKAIDTLLCRRMELTSANIAREAQLLMTHVFTQEPLWTEQVAAMAENLGVDIVLLGVYKKYGVLPLVGNLSSSALYLRLLSKGPLGELDKVRLMAQHVDSVVEQLTRPFYLATKGPSCAAALHFVCNIGKSGDGHWALLSLVCQPDRAPRILLLDSSNPFQLAPKARMCLGFIRRHVILSAQDLGCHTVSLKRGHVAE